MNETTTPVKTKPTVDKPPGGLTAEGKHPKIFVCSPYRPTSKNVECRKDELLANIERAKKACRILAGMGFLPLAPHLYFTTFLSDTDEKEREKGMRLGMEWLEESDEVFVFGRHISDGMAAEIARAKELGKPVRKLPEPGRIIELLLKELAEQELAEQEKAKQDTTNDTDNAYGTNTDNAEQQGAAESENDDEKNESREESIPKSRDFRG